MRRNADQTLGVSARTAGVAPAVSRLGLNPVLGKPRRAAVSSAKLVNRAVATANDDFAARAERRRCFDPLAHLERPDLAALGVDGIEGTVAGTEVDRPVDGERRRRVHGAVCFEGPARSAIGVE